MNEKAVTEVNEEEFDYVDERNEVKGEVVGRGQKFANGRGSLLNLKQKN